jgi:hypothetical protein
MTAMLLASKVWDDLRCLDNIVSSSEREGGGVQCAIWIRSTCISHKSWAIYLLFITFLSMVNEDFSILLPFTIQQINKWEVSAVSAGGVLSNFRSVGGPG